MLKKLRVIAIVLVIVCGCSIVAFAANSKGKPANESEVPGDWTMDQSNSTWLWFNVRDADGNRLPNALKHYSPKVRAIFADPDMSLFADHPDFAGNMNNNYDNPMGVIKSLTNKQMSTYLESLPKDVMSIRYLGEYPKGVPMPLLIFSKPKLEDPSGENLRALGKPIFYLRAQVHGNELAASAGAIMTAQRLSTQHPDFDGVLDKVSVIILPRINGDGTKKYQRGTTLVSGDTWATGAPDYFVSEGPGGGQSEYPGPLMGGLDMNRDNMWLSTPVIRAVSRVIAEYKPEICLDAHEYGSNSYYGLPEKVVSGDSFFYVTDPAKKDRIVLKDPGGSLVYYKEQITTQWANHMIIPESLFHYAENIQDKIIASMAQPSNPTGPYYWAPYCDAVRYGLGVDPDDKTIATGGLVSLDQIPAGSQRENMRRWADANGMVPELDAFSLVLEGGLDTANARNAVSIIPSLSFLLETRNPGGRWEFPRRVMGQYLGNLYYLRAVIDDLDNAMKLVNDARAEVLNNGKAENIGKPGNRMILTFKEPAPTYDNIVAQGVLHDDGTAEDIFGKRVESRFGMIPIAEVSRPYAYIMDGSYLMADEIASRMSNLGIEFHRTVEPMEIEVAAYTVTDAKAVTSFGARCGVTGAASQTVTRPFPAGSYIFYMEQQMANFAAILFEPLSWRSWIGKDLKNPNAILNKEVPFYRYEKTDRIPNTEIIDILAFDFTDVFHFQSKPFNMSELAKVRKDQNANGFAQTVTVYGELASSATFKAYLPSNGKKRSWYLRDTQSGSYIQRDIGFDSAMNRNYIEIAPNHYTSIGDGYYKFDVFATPATHDTDGGGSSGGCASAPFLMLPLACGLFALRLTRRWQRN